MSQRAQDRRWQTKFGLFTNGLRDTQRPHRRACAILQIAAQNGFEISLDDIYQRSRRPTR